MKIQFLLVPYDSGRREWRMGRGPSYLLRHGVGSSLRALGHEVDAEYVEPGGLDGPNPPASAEIATSFSLYRQVAVRARAARANGALPIVLGGNCGVTLGAIAAATMSGRGDLGVLWLDAHADFNTPETTVSGFLDGMGLAVLTGRCWRSLAMSCARDGWWRRSKNRRSGREGILFTVSLSLSLHPAGFKRRRGARWR